MGNFAPSAAVSFSGTILSSWAYFAQVTSLAVREVLWPPTTVPVKCPLPAFSASCLSFLTFASWSISMFIKCSEAENYQGCRNWTLRQTAMRKSLTFSPLSRVHEFWLHGLWLQLLKGVSTPAILPSPLDGSQLYSGSCLISNFQNNKLEAVISVPGEQPGWEIKMKILGRWPSPRQPAGVQNQGCSRLSEEEWGDHTLNPFMLGFVVGRGKDLVRLGWPHHGFSQKHMPSGFHSMGEAVKRILKLQNNTSRYSRTSERDVNYHTLVLHPVRPSPSH